MRLPNSRRILTGSVAAGLAFAALASSHREAPFITTHPKVDGTDFYMFNSYEAGRAGYVTLIANYQPFENPQGGPNYYTMDPKALYEIHIDNVGDGHEHLTFQFRFKVTDSGLAGVRMYSSRSTSAAVTSASVRSATALSDARRRSAVVGLGALAAVLLGAVVLLAVLLTWGPRPTGPAGEPDDSWRRVAGRAWAGTLIIRRTRPPPVGES